MVVMVIEAAHEFRKRWDNALAELSQALLYALCLHLKQVG